MQLNSELLAGEFVFCLKILTFLLIIMSMKSANLKLQIIL